MTGEGDGVRTVTAQDPRVTLTPEQRMLLEKLARGDVALGDAGRIPRRDGPGPPPLSFAQERIWFVSQMLPDVPLYHLCSALRVRARLDAGVVRRCLEDIARRHEVLRSSYPSVDGRPQQVIAPALDAPLVEIDLSDAADPERELWRVLDEEARAPFDLARGPLVRMRIVRLAPADQVVVWNAHHIVADSRSFAIVGAELGPLYLALAAGGASPFTPPPIQYADFAAWQREWLRGEVGERQLDHWRRCLAGAPPALELTTDMPRRTTQTFAGGEVPFRIGGDLLGALRTLARHESVTPFTVLLAAFAALLRRYTGDEDLVVGTPVSGRDRIETERLIGCFINTVALRMDLSGDPPFRELLRRAFETTMAAQRHQDVPFERVIEAVNPRRDLGRSPVFQVMLNLRTDEAASIAALGPSLFETFPRIRTATAQFDLMVDLVESPRGLSGVFEFRSDLFRAESIERMAAHYARLLAAAVGGPDRRLSAIPMLSDGERRVVIAGWNATERPDHRGHRLDTLVVAQARRTPGAVAVRSGRETLTYADVEDRSARLARYLRDRGVARGARVAICVERSIDMVVGILGILRAGAAYVPLDPEYPAARLALMLEDSSPAALVAEASLLERLPSPRPPAILVDADGPAILRTPRDDVAAGGGPRDLAYVIYTSGSTGRPKGVAVEHQSIANRVLWTVAAHGFTAADRFLQKTPIGFDASIWEIFAPLFVGASVILARPAGHRDAAYLARAVADERVTVLQLVPSMLRAFVEEEGIAGCAELRQVFAGGEALPRSLAARVAERLPGVRVHNLYGPTEASIDAASFEWARGLEDGTGTVPIGRPIGNMRIHIVDPHFEPVAISVPGQLVIGGIGLARGYYGRPDATAERFVPDPFGPEPGARLYLTGDLARYLTDGTIEFLGRADGQIKLRGYRIELGEIEAALRACDGVRDALVGPVDRGTASERLVAYVVPADGEIAPRAIRERLRQSLPEHMLPAAYVAVAELPRLPNGKVDRGAIAAPPAERSESGFVPPATETESRLAAIWGELLRTDRVGAEDDFFERGGHSLLAVQLVARVRAAFDVEIPVAALFESPSLRALASLIERTRERAAEAPAPAIVPRPRDGELPPSFAQERIWFLEHFVPGEPHYNLPIVVRLRGPLDVDALRRALDEVVRRHEVLRSRFPEVDGRPVQVIAPALALELERDDITELRASALHDAARAWIDRETQRLFDIERGPLIRARLLRVTEEQHVLVVVAHHIVTDGWSSEVLTWEITSLYAAFSAGRPSPLPDLPIQYADYAIWQREWLSGDALAPHLAYWEPRLRGAPMLDLPTDRPRPSQQSFRAAHVEATIPAETRPAVESLARRAGATPFMVLLAAFGALLGEHAGQRDVVVGTPVAGRVRAELEDLIGFFVNTLPLRIGLGGGPTFAELVGRARDATLGALAHEALPFEKLVEELQPARDLARTPIFQAMLAFQHLVPSRRAAGTVLVEPEVLVSGPTRCDLTLYAVDSGRDIRLSFEHATDLFATATIERLARQLAALIEAGCRDPARPIDDLLAACDPDAERAVAEGNVTAAEAGDGAVFERLEALAAASPRSIAAAHGDRGLTFGELDARAEALASALVDAGVAPESAVCTYLERGPELLVAMLGIWKARAAYVPLDPRHPARRAADLARQCRARALVTTPSLLPAIANAAGDGGLPRHVFVPPDAEAAAERTPPPPAHDRALAYVIYTSGSTGVPKGAMVEHRGMRNHLAAKIRDLRLGPSDRVAQTAPVSFDISVWQLLAGPMVGGTVHVLGDDVVHDPERLIAVVDRERITVLELVPSMIRAVLDHLELASRDAPRLEALRWLLSTGEALAPDLCDRWLARYPRIPVVNAYGPTECSDDVTHHVVSAPVREAVVPIGRPIVNTRLHVLDAALRRRPLGAIGELCVGGAGVGRGYLDDPARTAAAFVPDPFGAPGGRLYRTGDLVRHRADGALEYLGRADQQVKVRGNRVELGEIESALRTHPAVRDAAVLAPPPGDRLVAYVSGEGASPEALRRHLAERLPDFMLPTAFVEVEALPRTPSGKLDRAALPVPAPASVGEPVAPRTAVEEVLAGLWSQLLRVDRLGVTDNFFLLGGHSLLAMRLVSRVRAAFRIEIPVRVVFEAQTIAELAVALEAHEPAPGHVSRVAGIWRQVDAMSDDDVARALARPREGAPS